MEETRALLRGWITLFLRKRPRITDEKEVDGLVWPTSALSPEGETLLEVLGYKHEEVRAQERVKLARTRLIPDFILTKNGSPVMIIDDKHPQEDLDEQKGQVVDYFLKVDAPLGLMFNGHDLKLLVNTDHKELRGFEELKGEWVAETKLDDTEATVDLLLLLSAANLGADAFGLARRLAKARIAEKRKEDIADRLQQILEDPPPELFDAIIRMDTALSNLKATPEELGEAWSTDSTQNGDPSKVTVKAGARPNPTIRLRITQLCAALGWEQTKELLSASNIKNLNIWEDGRYTQLEWPGVPDGVCIGPVNTPTGMRIIEHLDRLLSAVADSSTP